MMSAKGGLSVKQPSDADVSLVTEVVKKPMRYKTFKRLICFANDDLWRISFGLTALSVNSFTNLSFPWIMGHALDRLETGNNCDFLIGSLGFFAIGSVASWVRVYCLGTATDNISNKLRKALFNSYMNKDIDFFEMNRNGELLSILDKDVQDTSEILTEKISNGLRSSNSALNGSILLYLTSPKLTAVSLSVVPLVGVGAMMISKYSKKLTEKLRVLNNESISYALERFDAFSTIRLNNREDYEKKKFGSFSNEILQCSNQRHFAYGSFMSFINMSTNLSLIAVLRMGGIMMSRGEITAGILARFAIQSAFVGLGFSGLSTFYSDLMRALDAAERIFTIIDENNCIAPMVDCAVSPSPLPCLTKSIPFATAAGGSTDVSPRPMNSPTPSQSPLTPQQSNTSSKLTTSSNLASAYRTEYADAEILKDDNTIEFVDVSFGYKTRSDVQVLTNFSIVIKPNGITCIVGKSGCGKSTILSLLSGLYQPVTGYIRYGDKVIASPTTAGSETPTPRTAATSWRHENIGVVEQTGNTLLSGTIAENIEYGKAGASQAEIETAAREAAAHDFIMSFPKGYQTQVGIGGSLLSGGQRARIAIARALIKDPICLLLDEATAALDEDNEREIIAVLKRLSRTKAIVVVTHSDAVKRIADHTYTLEDGVIVGEKVGSTMRE